jgi:sodium transport system ATP-binding protein
MDEKMIELNNVNKYFGTVHAVQNLSLQVPAGAITTLLGANGSGKTTCLRMIAGLIKPDSGSIRIDGHDIVRDRMAASASLGFFPDQFGLYARLSVREHIRYALDLRGHHPATRNAAMEEALSTMAIGDLADRRCAGFSAGQRVKVALACTIAGNPRTLIFDEPTRALDLYAVKLLRITLKQLRARGHAILLASHVMADVEELSDSVAVMAHGKLITQATCTGLRLQTGKDNLEDAFFALSGFDMEKIA